MDRILTLWNEGVKIVVHFKFSTGQVHTAADKTKQNKAKQSEKQNLGAMAAIRWLLNDPGI